MRASKHERLFAKRLSLLFLGFLASSGLSLWFFMNGMVGNALFLALGALSFGLPFEAGPFPTVKSSFGKKLAVSFGLLALAMGAFAFYSSTTFSYSILDEGLESGWSSRASLSNDPLSPNSGVKPCVGSRAALIDAKQPETWFLLYHNFVPVNRSKYPVEAVEFSVNTEALDSQNLAVALEIGANQHIPDKGILLRSGKWVQKTYVGCSTVRIPLADFAFGDQALYGIRFTLSKPDKVVLDAVRLVPRGESKMLGKP